MSDKSRGWTLALLGDLHSGHPFALHPDTPTLLPDDEPITPNSWQLKEWDFWCTAWDTVNRMRRKRTLVVVHDGDAIEGIHHGTTQLMTQRRDVQERIHYRCMVPALERAGFRQDRDRLFYVTGTDAHIGPGSSIEERISRALLGIKLDDNSRGSYARHHLLLRLGKVLTTIAHHGPGIGARTWLRGNNLRWFLRSYHLACLESGREMPRYIIRAHRHQFDRAEIRDHNQALVSEAFVLPGWKLKDEYVYKIDPDGIGQVGMLVIQIDPDGATEWKPLLLSINQDTEEEIACE